MEKHHGSIPLREQLTAKRVTEEVLARTDWTPAHAVGYVRSEFGLTAEELAKLSGLPSPVIERIEQGESTGTGEELSKLLGVLGLKLGVVKMPPERSEVYRQPLPGFPRNRTTNRNRERRIRSTGRHILAPRESGGRTRIQPGAQSVPRERCCRVGRGPGRGGAEPNGREARLGQSGRRDTRGSARLAAGARQASNGSHGKFGARASARRDFRRRPCETRPGTTEARVAAIVRLPQPRNMPVRPEMAVTLLVRWGGYPRCCGVSR